MGFLVPPYSYHNGGAAGSIPVSMVSTASRKGIDIAVVIAAALHYSESIRFRLSVS